jgi:ABC-2 type transport system permease protein
MALVRALYRRDWEIERTYQMSLLLSFVNVGLLAFSLYFISKLVENPASLAEFDGTYFDFAIVGIAVNSFAGVGLQGFTGSLVREQSTGTIDLLLASPARHTLLIVGIFLFPYTLAVAEIAGLLIIGIGIIGSGISLQGVLLSIPILLLTSLTFAAVGIAAAGVLLLTKRGDPISGPFYQANLLLSGTLYPIGELPELLRVIGYLLPATWGIQAMRELLLADAGWRDVAPEALILCGFVVVLLPIGMLVFRRSLGYARRLGVVGSY